MVNQVFISYRHEGPEHSRAVRRLGELLKQAKIPVILDQFFIDEHAGGPDIGWPKWSQDCAIQSRCVLIIGSEGWFAAYDKKSPAGIGLGAAAEADICRQSIWDDQGNNARIRLVFLDNFTNDRVPVGLRAWHQFRPFDADEQLNQLIRWVADSLGLKDIQPPTVHWPDPLSFQPELADRTQEWPVIVDLLAGRSRERILLFEGASGLGKSELIRQAVAYAKKMGIFVARLDLKGILKLEDLLGQIDLELGSLLPNFSREGAAKTHLLRKDLRALRQPVLFVFDTYEVAAENKAIVDWLNQHLLAEVETALGVTVIVAGQKVPDSAMAVWRELARHIPLQPIKEIGPWQDWVSQRYPSFHDKGDLSTVLKLAEGNPSVVANYCALIAKS